MKFTLFFLLLISIVTSNIYTMLELFKEKSTYGTLEKLIRSGNESDDECVRFENHLSAICSNVHRESDKYEIDNKLNDLIYISINEQIHSINLRDAMNTYPVSINNSLLISRPALKKFALASVLLGGAYLFFPSHWFCNPRTFARILLATGIGGCGVANMINGVKACKRKIIDGKTYYDKRYTIIRRMYDSMWKKRRELLPYYHWQFDRWDYKIPPPPPFNPELLNSSVAQPSAPLI